MDVDFLSGMIRELMLDHDSLNLPGLGSFVVEDMPASFSDKGYTINPPYRRLSFVERPSGDNYLAELYAGANPQAPKEAEAVLVAFLAQIKEELMQRKIVELPGLGRLRATRENHFFFVADEDLDISPEACGLAPVSLKTHSAPVIPEISSLPLSCLPPILQEVEAASHGEQIFIETEEVPQNTPVVATSHGEQIAIGTEEFPDNKAVEAAPAPSPSQTHEPQTRSSSSHSQNRKRLPAPLRWAFGLLATACVLLAAFVAVSRLAPEFTDKLLYTQEELDIINYPENGLGLPG